MSNFPEDLQINQGACVETAVEDKLGKKDKATFQEEISGMNLELLIYCT